MLAYEQGLLHVLGTRRPGSRWGEATQLSRQMLHQAAARRTTGISDAAPECLQPGACLALHLRWAQRPIQPPA